MRSLAEVETDMALTIGKGYVPVADFDVVVAGKRHGVTAVLVLTVVVKDADEPVTGRTLVLKTDALVPDEDAMRWVPTAAARVPGGRVWNQTRRPKTLAECKALREASDARAMQGRQAS